MESSDVSTEAETGPGAPPVEETTISEIWSLRRNGKHREVIRRIEELMTTGDPDYDTKGLCLFLQGDSYRQIGDFTGARARLEQATRECPKAKYTDPRYGDIWISRECDTAMLLLAEKDTCAFPESSADYTSLGWTYLNRKRLNTATAMAEACIARFRDAAAQQQSDHEREYGSGWPTLEPNPNKNENILARYWALYDVGTCFFILGQVYEKQADMARENQRLLYEKAVSCYNEIIRKYAGAQCFDRTGPWYWRVKEGAERRVNLINSERLRSSGTP